MMTETIELQSSNGRMGEIGTAGLEVYWGQVEKADNSKLFWPGCYDLFNRLLRRDPQVAQWRTVSGAMASKVDWYWELATKDPTPAEQQFVDFLNTIWDDLPGGQRRLIDTYIHYILMGWIWFENVPARRAGHNMVNDDGLIGFSKIAMRDHSSFSKWDIDESTGELRGFVQHDYPNPEVTIPLDRSTHVTLGDPTSPEGLSPFEALWRLENFMHNLELIFGIGSEHAAGHAKFQSEQQLTAEDKANIQEAARALLAAQEGNYILLPGHISAEVMDVPFAGGPTVLEAIKFYGHLKAQVLNMQWMSLSLTSDAGSNASMVSSTGMWITAFNAQMAGAAKQIGQQLAEQLRRYNSGQFGSVKRLPVLKATPIENEIDLLELAQFVTAVLPLLDTTPEDFAAIRRKSGFLPEVEVQELVEDEQDSQEDQTDSEPQDEQQDGDMLEEAPEEQPEETEESAEFMIPKDVYKEWTNAILDLIRQGDDQLPMIPDEDPYDRENRNNGG